MLLPPLIAGLWLLDHLRPRHSHFEERKGDVVATDSALDDMDVSNVISESVTVRSDTGLEINFRVLRPASTERVPLVILLAGHRTGSNAVALVGDPGSMAVAALDYPYHGPEKLRSVWEAVSSLPTIQQGLLDTPPAVSLALDWLITQPWVDPERVELIGASLGTPFAAVAGARDSRFRRVWLIHGGADNRAWLNAALRRKISNETLRSTAAGLLHLVAHGASFDSEHWVSKISPQSVVVIGARNDESLTRENVLALYEAAGEPRQLIWTEGGHVLRSRPEVVQQLLDIVREQM